MFWLCICVYNDMSVSTQNTTLVFMMFVYSFSTTQQMLHFLILNAHKHVNYTIRVYITSDTLINILSHIITHRIIISKNFDL